MAMKSDPGDKRSRKTLPSSPVNAHRSAEYAGAAEGIVLQRPETCSSCKKMFLDHARTLRLEFAQSVERTVEGSMQTDARAVRDNPEAQKLPERVESTRPVARAHQDGWCSAIAARRPRAKDVVGPTYTAQEKAEPARVGGVRNRAPH